MPANLEQAKPIVEEIQRLASMLDHVITLYLHSRIYSNGDINIDLTDAQKEKLEHEYDDYKDELKEKINELL